MMVQFISIWLQLSADRRAMTKTEYCLVGAIIGVTILSLWWLLADNVHPGAGVR